jgi:hypothetical protein
MSPSRIRTFLDDKSFKPFTVYTGNGNAVDVISREYVFLHPGGRTLTVAVPRKKNAKEEEDFQEHNIDVFLITKVVTPVERRRGANGHAN